MTIQTDVYVIILITIILGVAMILLSKKIDKTDPLEKPKGVIVPVLMGIEMVYNTVRENVGKKIADKLTPYILVLWVYIFVSNTISLFGLSSPTANFSVTILLSFLTWLMIQVAELKFGGFKAYMHAFIEPIAPMLPMNIIGKFSTMLSMALRLFGNITCGSIMMSLVYMGTQNLSNLIAGLVGAQGNVFNFMAPIIAPVLHMYFDLFAGFIQTLVFVTLTIVLLGNDIPEEEKN
ncbi:MAG: F0F1 ATP synthase subunit A [Erysipelotrichaceae bacterium]|nr:F0F1 ATP synthase subunit A [Erysipelotrichaceae bacterium]MDY6035521.1 F0F1 ATP synthase subunit A [Bulleidia sp.]